MLLQSSTPFGFTIQIIVSYTLNLRQQTQFCIYLFFFFINFNLKKKIFEQIILSVMHILEKSLNILQKNSFHNTFLL